MTSVVWLPGDEPEGWVDPMLGGGPITNPTYGDDTPSVIPQDPNIPSVLRQAGDPFLTDAPYYPMGRPGDRDPNADPTAGLPAGYRYIGFEGAIADQNNVVVYEPAQGWVGPGPAPAWVAGLPQVGIANVNPVTNLAPVAPTPPVAGAMAPQMPQQPARRPLGVIEDQGGDADGSRGAPGGGGTGAPISSTEGSADYFAGDPAEELGGNPADPSNFWGALENVDWGGLIASGLGRGLDLALTVGTGGINRVGGHIVSAGMTAADLADWRSPGDMLADKAREFFGSDAVTARDPAGTAPGALPGAGTAPTDPWSDQALRHAEASTRMDALRAGYDLDTMSRLDREEAGGFYTPGPQGAAPWAREMISAWDPRNSPEVENAAYYDRQYTMPGDRYASFTGRPTNYLAAAPGARASMSIGATPDVNSPLQDWVANSQAKYGNTYGMSIEDMHQNYRGGKYNLGFDWQGNDITPASAEGGSTAVAPGSLAPSREYDWYGGGDTMEDLKYAPSPASYDMGGYEGDSQIGSAGPDVSAEDYDWYGSGDQEGGGGGDYADDDDFSGYADEDSDPGDQYGV